MIRVTQQQLHWTALGGMSDARLRLQQAQQVAMSGVEVSRPSDDPAASSRARLITSLLDANDQYRANISQGIARLQTAESALAESGNIVVRAKELALYMANATQSAEERASVAIEIDQLRTTLIQMANSEHNGPVDTTTGVFTYDVNTWNTPRVVEVGPSQTGEIGASGAMAFSARMADPNSVDVIAVLGQLAADLRANDPDAVRLRIDELDTSLNQVLTERARVGTRLNRLETADASAQQAATLFERLRSDLVDADAAEAFSTLTMAENALQAAVTVSARIMGPSLLDKM
jgi:flagellar hook-associated protein 3 FlgL